MRAVKQRCICCQQDRGIAAFLRDGGVQMEGEEGGIQWWRSACGGFSTCRHADMSAATVRKSSWNNGGAVRASWLSSHSLTGVMPFQMWMEPQCRAQGASGSYTCLQLQTWLAFVVTETNGWPCYFEKVMFKLLWFQLQSFKIIFILCLFSTCHHRFKWLKSYMILKNGITKWNFFQHIWK